MNNNVISVRGVKEPDYTTMKYTRQREDMIRTIEIEVEATRRYTGVSNLDACVINALRMVPRHRFVPPEMEIYAYDDCPLSIGNGQTISQPYIVAIMTQLLSPQEDHIILDIGTGSGYQAAIMSRIVEKVYGVEIVDELAKQAQQCFKELGYNNIELMTGDGNYGWPENAPYDGILVAAASPIIPPELVEQLTPGGIMIIPIGLPYMSQQLLLVKKHLDGEIETSDILSVAFVPLVGEVGINTYSGNDSDTCNDYDYNDNNDR